MYSKILLLAAMVSLCMATQHYYHIPQPYSFGYEIKDPHHGAQWRQETRDAHGAVHGSYGYVDKWGIKRHVDYVADKHGFRAKVKTNEPGTGNQHPAHVKLVAHSYQPHSNYILHG